MRPLGKFVLALAALIKLDATLVLCTMAASTTLLPLTAPSIT